MEDSFVFSFDVSFMVTLMDDDFDPLETERVVAANAFVTASFAYMNKC